MRDLLSVLNALAEPNRLRLLMCLYENELCVCNLVDFIELADSTVSKHMSILREAGLVEARKKGRWVYYRLADRNSSPLIAQAIDLVRTHLTSDPIIAEDAARLAEVLGRDGGTKCQAVTTACESNEVFKTADTA